MVEEIAVAADVSSPADNGYDGIEDLVFVTIDSESTKDIDDAMCVIKEDTGYRILVGIANPTKLVQIGSTEDCLARSIAGTAYIRDRAVRRMLPPLISENKGSLIAGQHRRTMLFDIGLDENLEVVAFKVRTRHLRVSHRLSYEQIPQIIQDGEHPLREMLTTATTLARLLLQGRRNKGALAMYDLSRMLLADEEGNLRIFRSIDEVIGNILVQEVMILTNHLTAKFMVEKNVPGIFRNHEPRLSAPPANELAATIEAWLKSGSEIDGSAVVSQFAALAGKAKYDATTKGHYGLNLPTYIHVTSPLRRYADLVNLRQIEAHLKGRVLPYSIDDLSDLANDLNDAIDRRKEERSDGFKLVVQKTATTALERGNVSKLADHELRQALKLAHQAGYVPEVLTSELIDRLSKSVISDGLVDTLFVELPTSLLCDELKSAVMSWLVLQPSKAMHVLLHGQQAGFFGDVSITATGEAASFSGAVSVLLQDGTRIDGQGGGTRKREAEQNAAIAVLARLLGVETRRSVVKESLPEGSKTNFKGKLLELCQKHGIPAPAFQSTGQGPSHAMFFHATVSLSIGEVVYTGLSNKAGSKKEAESLAARHLLDQIEQQFAKQKSGGSQNGANQNPVGHLQEIAQSMKVPLPSYDFSQIGTSFVCTVTVHSQNGRRYQGKAANKQEAKKQAALAALNAH